MYIPSVRIPDVQILVGGIPITLSKRGSVGYWDTRANSVSSSAPAASTINCRTQYLLQDAPARIVLPGRRTFWKKRRTCHNVLSDNPPLGLEIFVVESIQLKIGQISVVDQNLAYVPG